MGGTTYYEMSTRGGAQASAQASAQVTTKRYASGTASSQQRMQTMKAMGNFKNAGIRTGLASTKNLSSTAKASTLRTSSGQFTKTHAVTSNVVSQQETLRSGAGAKETQITVEEEVKGMPITSRTPRVAQNMQVSSSRSSAQVMTSSRMQ